MTQHCPRCDSEVNTSATITDPLNEGTTRLCPVCHEPLDPFRTRAPSPSLCDALPVTLKPVEEPPPGERLSAFSGDGRLLIEIAPGSSNTIRNLGLCILGGMLFMGYFLWDALNAPRGPQIDGVAVLGTMMFLSLPILGGWLYARFGRTRVRVESGWLEVENSLFGMKWGKEYALGLESRATLIATHRLFEELHHAVRVSAVGEQPVFGRWLFQVEQEWIVRQINRHLENGDWEEVTVNENAELEYSLMDGFQWGE